MAEYQTIKQLPKKLNIRDLGGFPTKDGRHVKKGLLFRSSISGRSRACRKVRIPS